MSNNCQQRKLFISLENTNHDRVEIVNPYNNFTKQQLDMRRKAEILKYKKNANIITRTEKFRILSQNSGKRNRACVNDPVRVTPTSSSNVPGPVIMLNNSITAPLYNYVNEHQEQTSLIPPPNLKAKPYDGVPIIRTNILTVLKPVANLAILSPNYRNYSFTMSFPFFISITGNHTQLNQNNGTIVQSIAVSIKNVQFQVSYNDRQIPTTPTVNNLSENMDVLLNSPNNIFSARKYVGIIRFANFRLKTCSEYVYTTQISANINYIGYDSQGNVIPNFVSTGLGYTILVNSSTSSDYNSVSNCTMINPPTLPVIPFSVSAVPFGIAGPS